MDRQAALRLFLVGVVLFGAGLLLAQASILVGTANGALVRDGAEFARVRVTPGGYAMVGLASLAAMALVGGMLSLVIALLGAFVDPGRLRD